VEDPGPLAGAHSRALHKERLARAYGYEVNGGGFNSAVSRLRTLGLVSGRGELRISNTLV